LGAVRRASPWARARAAFAPLRFYDDLLAQLDAELERLGADHPEAACRLVASERFGSYLAQDADGRPFSDRDEVRGAAHLELYVPALMIQRRAELATDLTRRRLHALLEPLKAVRRRTGERAIVRTTRIGADARDVLKKLGMSTPKPILAAD
jgi:hypothetical protein